MKQFLKLSLLSFSFFPLLPNSVKGFPIVFLFISSIFYFNKNKYGKVNFKKIILFSSLYLTFVFSLLYTSNLERVDIPLVSRISLLIFPIIGGMLSATNLRVSKEDVNTFITFNVFSSIIYCFLLVFYLYYLGTFTGGRTLHDSLSFVNNEMFLINQHPIYGSIFIALSILLLSFLFINQKNRYLLIFALLILVFVLFLLGRKGVIMATFFSLFITLVSFKYLPFYKIIVGSFVVVIFALSFSNVRERFKEVISISSYQKIDNNSTNIRFNIYKCALEVIKKSPLIGYGIGDANNKLKECYIQKKLFNNETYNSHNQYLGVLLISGILGLFSLIFLIIKTLKKAFTEKNYILFLVTCFFTFIMLFENILARQAGLTLFSFYFLLLNFLTIHFNGTPKNITNRSFS